MATNIINGHKYIGQTINSLERRKQSHMSEVKYNKTKMYFHRALKKYGPKNFNWEILHECANLEELNKYEADYIGLYNTFNNGYNLTYGGGGIIPNRKPPKVKQKPHTTKRIRKSCSIETRKRISESKKGKNNAMYDGDHWTGKNNPKAKAVIVKNKHFNTIKEAADFLNISSITVSRRLKSKDTNYRYA